MRTTIGLRRLAPSLAFISLALAVGPADAQDDPGMEPTTTAPTTTPATPTATDDDPEGHIARATGAVRAHRFEEALRAYKAAYALRQSPELLYAIGLTAQRLGYAADAVDWFNRFLVAATDAPAAQRADAQRRIDVLRPLAGLAGSAAPPGLEARDDGRVRFLPMRYELRANWKLIGGGIGLLSASYTAALITGSLFASFTSNLNSGQGDLRGAGGALIVPVAGPFISGLVFRDWVWSTTWILVDGLAQVSGLAMIIVGAKDRVQRLVPVTRAQILPWTGPGVVGITAAGVF